MSQDFEAGRLKKYLHEWEKITSDKNILNVVKQCPIEFIDNIAPKQYKRPFQTIFNEIESLAVDKEIEKLLKQKVIKTVSNKNDCFLSNNFSTAKEK